MTRRDVQRAVDLEFVVERLRRRDHSRLRVDREPVDRRRPGQRELVERRLFAVGRRHDADLDARRLVLLDVEYVDGQLEARSLVVHVDHVDRQLGCAYNIRMHAASTSAIGTVLTTVVYLFVCLSTEWHKKLWPNFHKIGE